MLSDIHSKGDLLEWYRSRTLTSIRVFCASFVARCRLGGDHARNFLSVIPQKPMTSSSEKPAAASSPLLRVLHIAAGLEPHAGGPPVSILTFCAAGVPLGIAPLIVVPVESVAGLGTREITQRVASVGGLALPFSRIKIFKSKAERWGISPALAWWVIRHAGEFDLVVVHSAWLFSSLAGLIGALLRARPCILVPHESLTRFDVSRRGNPIRPLLKSGLKRLYGRYCTLVIFASERERSDSISREWRARTVVIHHAILDPGEEQRIARAPLPTEHLRLGFLGRLHEKKNVDRLLQTLANLPPDISLIIGGDGDPKIKASLHKLEQKLGLESRVRWLGFVGSDEKNDFFRQIDILVMPSAYESFGLVAAEAMVRGVPVIVSPATGIAEIIAAYGGGIVAKVEELEGVIQGLKANPERLQELSSEALNAARTELSLSTFGLRLKNEYLEVLVRERRKTAQIGEPTNSSRGAG